VICFLKSVVGNREKYSRKEQRDLYISVKTRRKSLPRKRNQLQMDFSGKRRKIRDEQPISTLRFDMNMESITMDILAAKLQMEV